MGTDAPHRVRTVLQIENLKHLRDSRGYALRPPPAAAAASSSSSSSGVVHLSQVGVIPDPHAQPRPPSDSDESAGTRNLGRDDVTQNYDWSDDSLDSYASKQ